MPQSRCTIAFRIHRERLSFFVLLLYLEYCCLIDITVTVQHYYMNVVYQDHSVSAADA